MVIYGLPVMTLCSLTSGAWIMRSARSRPWDKGGPGHPDSDLRASVWSKNKGGAPPPRAPPLDPLPLGVKTPLLLNSSYVLFLRCRSWDNTLENCFVRNWLSPRARVRIILEKTRWKFSLRATLAKQREPWAKQLVFQNSISRVCKSGWGRLGEDIEFSL